MGEDNATIASKPNTDIFDCFMVLPGWRRIGASVGGGPSLSAPAALRQKVIDRVSKIPANPLFFIEISQLSSMHRQVMNQGVRKFDTLPEVRCGTANREPVERPPWSVGISDERRGSKTRKKEQ